MKESKLKVGKIECTRCKKLRWPAAMYFLTSPSPICRYCITTKDLF